MIWYCGSIQSSVENDPEEPSVLFEEESGLMTYCSKQDWTVVEYGCYKNIQKNILLHFLIHIDVLMLCSKFELIPIKIFGVMTNLKNGPVFEKYLRL